MRKLTIALALLALAAVPQIASAQGTLFVESDKVCINNPTCQAKFHVENTAGNDSDDFAVDIFGGVGVGTTTPTTEALLPDDNFRMAIINTTPRLVMQDDGNIWEFDSFLNSFRIFQPGVVQMRVDSGGNVHARGNFFAGTARPVPDYVFEPDYELMSIADLEQFVTTNKHLPNIPSAAEMGDTVNVSDLQLRLLEKIEELALYTIEQQKTIDDLSAQIAELKHQ